MVNLKQLPQIFEDLLDARRDKWTIQNSWDDLIY